MTLRARFIHPTTPTPTVVTPPAAFARGGGARKAKKARKVLGVGPKGMGGCGANAKGGGGFQKGNTCGGGGKAAGERTINRMVLRSKLASEKAAAAKTGKPVESRTEERLRAVKVVKPNKRAREIQAARVQEARALVAKETAGRKAVIGRMVAKSKGAALAGVARVARVEAGKGARAKAVGRLVARSADSVRAGVIGKATAEQRAANAAAAKARPVHELERPTWEVGYYRESIVSQSKRLKEIEEAAAKLRPDWEKADAKYKKIVEKMYDYSLSTRTRKNWEKKLDALRPEYQRLRDVVKNAPDLVKSFREDIARYETKLAEALADPKNKQTMEYGKLQSKFPNLIPPGPIADRLAAYKVGDAKVKAVRAIDEKYEKMSVKLKAEIGAHRKTMGDLMEKQAALIDPYAKRMGQASRRIPPEVEAKVDALQKRIALAAQKNRDALGREDHLLGQRRAEVEKLLVVKDGADVRGPDVPAGFKGMGDELAPLSAGIRGRADESLAWLNKVTARGDSSTAHILLGQKNNLRAYYGDKFIALDPHDTQTTVVHEYGHAIEGTFTTGPDSVARRSQEFLKHRVGDEPLVNLKDKFGNFDAHEVGRKDRFDEAFSERQAYYVGKHYGSGSSEILSMGLQKLHEDPVHFANKDPEYFKFVTGILDGSLR